MRSYGAVLSSVWKRSSFLLILEGDGLYFGEDRRAGLLLSLLILGESDSFTSISFPKSLIVFIWHSISFFPGFSVFKLNST